MHWNHRVVRTIHAPGTDAEEPMYAIHEAYYDLPEDGGEIAITTDPTPVLGDDLAGLRETLERMLRALDHPVLDGDANPIVELPAVTS